MTNRNRIWVRTLRWLSAGTLAVACGGATDKGQSSGESHFLDYCASSCGEGLDCISGICTRGCLVGEAQCAALNPDATCTNESVEPGSVAVCDVACQSTSDCAALGAEHECTAGYCRGGSPTGPGASCTEYWYIDPEPFCGACECGSDRRACEALESCFTGAGAPVYPCPNPADMPRDPLTVTHHKIDGELLTLEVIHGGGCEPHDYSVCYEPALTLAEPPAIDLFVLHDAHGDACDAALSRTLRFSLSPLSALGSGLLSTPYGLYASGELSCDDRKNLSASRIRNLVEQVDLSCQTDNDCETVSVDTACHLGCGTLVSSSAAASFEAERARIDETVCAAYTQAGCPAPFAPPCVPPLPLRCVDNLCTN